jgi:hypothetical protein
MGTRSRRAPLAPLVTLGGGRRRTDAARSRSTEPLISIEEVNDVVVAGALHYELLVQSLCRTRLSTRDQDAVSFITSVQSSVLLGQLRRAPLVATYPPLPPITALSPCRWRARGTF